MIKSICGHSVNINLLNPGSNILDLGCRGFEFTNYFKKKHNVYSVDFGDLKGDYFQQAISYKKSKYSIGNKNDLQASCLIDGDEIEAISIQEFSESIGIKKWDLVKMNIEGSEYEIMKNLSHPYCEQICVSFHAHCGYQTKEQIDELLEWLHQWYDIYNEIWESRYCAGFNYWDILLIRK
jgi:hypothetical protein